MCRLVVISVAGHGQNATAWSGDLRALDQLGTLVGRILSDLAELFVAKLKCA